MTETEHNETTFKWRHICPSLGIYMIKICSASGFQDIYAHNWKNMQFLVKKSWILGGVAPKIVKKFVKKMKSINKSMLKPFYNTR